MLQGVNRHTQKCHKAVALNFLQGVIRGAQRCHILFTLKGAIPASRQRHFSRAPTSFIWCQLRIAAMPIEQRTKGRVIPWPQKCYSIYTLPTQFNGVMVKTQKCQDIVALRERSTSLRRNAGKKPPLPTSLTGAITTSQKCYKVNAPREGSSIGRRNAIRAMPFPPVTGGHSRSAEMPSGPRPHRIWATKRLQKCHGDSAQ
jgi:hypothetical protein